MPILFTTQKLSNISHAEAKLVFILGYINHELPISAKHNLLHKNTTGIKTLNFCTQEWYIRSPEYPKSLFLWYM